MIGGGGFKALLSAGGGKGLYAGVWGNLAGERYDTCCDSMVLVMAFVVVIV